VLVFERATFLKAGADQQPPAFPPHPSTIPSAVETFGFIYANGALKTISDPNGVGSTVVNGVNNIGDIVGFYADSKVNTDGFVAEARTVGIPVAH
jgi:hypothetical protein